MILKQIKNYLQDHKQATLSELSHSLAYEPAVIEMAVKQWIQKGKICIKSPEKSSSCSCSGCTVHSCSKSSPVYSWL